MRLAVLSDVHANLPAMEACLERARRWGADEVLLLGDLVNLGPHPEEVVALARQRGLESVLGDHDALVARGERPPQGYWDDERRAHVEREVEWTLSRLSKPSLKWLAALPPSRRLVADGLLVHLAHGSPRSPWEGLGPGVPDEALRSVLDAARCDVLVVGHTHAPEVRDLGRGRWFLNAGSVGRPARDPEACMLLMDVAAREFEVARVAFDVAAVHRDSLKAGHPHSGA